MNYDETKKMLNTLRKLNSKNLTENINEQKNLTNEVYQDYENYNVDKQYDDFVVINDVEVKILSSDKDDMNLKEDQKNAISQIIDNFKQQVSQIVEFDPGFTIKQDQIRLDGTLTDEDIDFVYIVGKENGLYLNAEMLKLDNEVLPLLEKLHKFEDTFKSSMEGLLSFINNN